MAERLPDCPVCGSSTRIYKFSQVYIASITETANRSDADRALLAEVFCETDDPAQQQAILSLFSPPPAIRLSPRAIHPDQVVFVFGLAALALISTTFFEKTSALWPLYGGLGGLIILYVIFRRKILVRLKIPVRPAWKGSRADDEIILHWSHLYYCARDNCVFDPQRGDWAGLEDAYQYLRGS